MLKLDNYKITTKLMPDVINLALKLSKNKTSIINTINAHSYVTAKSDFQFQQALEHSDLLIPDGASIALATKLFNLKPKFNHRIPGPDFFEAFNEKANKNNLTYFFLGATNETLKKITTKLKQNHPNIKVYSHAPGFYPFSKNENNDIISKINKIKPNVLWVGMTAPKQEKWSFENKLLLKANLIVPIGAAFDFYVGTVKRAPMWMRNNKLEWLHRFASNPKRLYKRYIHSNILFAYYMARRK